MNTITKPVVIRCIADNDLPEVFGIEQASFPYPWADDEFRQERRKTNVVMKVAEHNGRVAGYVIYELTRRYVAILNIAVHAACHRRGIGRALVFSVIEHAALLKKPLVTEVCEQNLDGQLFFRAVGFKADCVLPDFYERVPDVTAYGFTYSGGSQ